MDLSICITTFNLENEIDQTLESVFAQKTAYSFEVLIGDDGSSDGTMDRILAWEAKYPQVISHYQMPREADKKYNPIFRASANRVNLLKHAKGTYITFLDGDDFYTDTLKFQKQLDILNTYPQCTVCAHNMNLYYPDSTTEPMARVSEKAQVLNAKQYWASGHYIHAEACILRREGLQFDSRFDRYFDDNFIVFLGLQQGDLYYMPEEMANYRQNPTGFMRTEQVRMDIINLLDCDMEILYNHAWKNSALRRHAAQYLAVHRCQTTDLAEKYPLLYQQAKEDACQYTLDAIAGQKTPAYWEMLGFYLLGKALRIPNKLKRIFHL